MNDLGVLLLLLSFRIRLQIQIHIRQQVRATHYSVPNIKITSFYQILSEKVTLPNQLQGQYVSKESFL